MKKRIRDIIFKINTPASQLFDIVLLVTILLSLVVVMLDSVQVIHTEYGFLLYILEWIFTILFTVEYAVRIWVAKKKKEYIFSFYGIVDLLSIIPTYLSLFLVGAQYLLIIRIFRLLRVFRVFKLVKFLEEGSILGVALKSSIPKITAFLLFVLALVSVIGSFMYLIEGPENGFTNIPKSIYWAIVTLTTVGYGDIVPQTPLGKLFASLVMVIGYAIIAVPTGIVSVALHKADGSHSKKRKKK